MKLDSVRELKQALAARMLPKIENTITTRSSVGQAAVAKSRAAAQPLSSMALGVTPKGKGYRLAVRVQKRAFQNGPEIQRIIEQAKGEVDVRYVGRIGKRTLPWYQRNQRPLLIGCSVGHVDVTAGTLGCFVKRRDGNGLFLLSNNHVLANENRGRRGDPIIQPGDLDGGDATTDAVALLDDFVRLKKQGANLVDCALAEIRQDIAFDPRKLRGATKLAGLGDDFIDEGTEVSKIGRTTGLTHGRVTAFEMDNVVVDFGIGNLRFDNQIEIEGSGRKSFSDGGDSGSLIFDQGKLGVALLFAGSDQGGRNSQGLTYANPLAAVFDALKVDLAP